MGGNFLDYHGSKVNFMSEPKSQDFVEIQAQWVSVRSRIRQKIGDGEPVGTVFKGRKISGLHDFNDQNDEDLILTRILWLNGLDDNNSNTYDRYIYIHGTNHERDLGKPASMGCIRMSNRDILEVYDLLPIGAKVLIVE